MESVFEGGDCERLARERLAKDVYDFVAGGGARSGRCARTCSLSIGGRSGRLAGCSGLGDITRAMVVRA
jgi:hypothetical protein